MGSLLYLREGVENSPYAHLLDPINWQEIMDVFSKDACRLMGLSIQSPLSVWLELLAIIVWMPTVCLSRNLPRIADVWCRHVDVCIGDDMVPLAGR